MTKTRKNPSRICTPQSINTVQGVFPTTHNKMAKSRNHLVLVGLMRILISQINIRWRREVNDNKLVAATTRKKKRSNNRGNQQLPDDVVVEILLKLPSVKAIVRCRCVCKAWRSLIKSPSFIAKHLQLQTRCDYDKYDFLVKSLHKTSEDYMVSFLSHQTLQALDTFRLSSHSPSDDGRLICMLPRIEVVGCCDGVVCLLVRGSFNPLFLWNPATRELKVVPNSLCLSHARANNGRLTCSRDRSFTYTSTSTAFGYDANNDDYKILLIRIFQHADKYFVREHEIEVYSLKSNSWRLHAETDLDLHLHINIYRRSVYTNGMSSWLADRRLNQEISKEEIISFDMSNETIVSTCVPDVVSYAGEIGVINGSLAIFDRIKTSNYAGYDCHYDIWVLGNYGVKESWSKLLHIDPSSIERTDHPLGLFWKNITEIFLRNKDGELVLLDAATQQRRRLQISGRGCQRMQIFRYKESLVPVNGVILNGENMTAALQQSSNSGATMFDIVFYA